MTNGVQYAYDVTAVNATGEGAHSNELVASPGPPPAPTLDSAVAGDSSVALSWTTHPGGGAAVVGYRVYRGTSSGGETLLATLGLASSYDDTTVTNGTTYYYEVSAFSSLGEGERSNELSATPAVAPGAPSLDSATGGDNAVALTWSAPDSTGGGITAYSVYRGTLGRRDAAHDARQRRPRTPTPPPSTGRPTSTR